MNKYKHIFGPVPSRRMGLSVGVSPIPPKYCNYNCVYCQLGRTTNLINSRKEFYSLEEIVEEFKDYLKENIKFDVVTIVGEGEPTLYSNLGNLILELKKLTCKPIAVITNGFLLYDKNVRKELLNADIVLPSLDGCDEVMFKKVNRAYGKIDFKDVYNGLVKFSKQYTGQLWVEVMIVKNLNDNKDALLKLKNLLKDIDYSRLYINTPVRPPAESWVEPISGEIMENAVDILKGISIDMLSSKGFFSEVEDDYEAILSIIRRHPMNQYEIKSFLNSRKCENANEILCALEENKDIDLIEYRGYTTYRFKTR